MLSDEDKQWIKELLEGRLDPAEERMKAVVADSVRNMETRVISEFWKWGRSSDAR